MRIVISLGICGMVPSSSAIVLGNMEGKVNEGMCVIENWLLIGFERWPLVRNTAVTTTDWNPVEWGNLNNFIYPSIKSFNNPGDISLP